MSVARTPWERRLEDLAHLLSSCGATYFDPELFRRNVNNFLQTARTVTFIIQKNKADIPDFASWYQEHVLEPWKGDEIMGWAKEARNVIEKEGDLELHSSLQLTLIFSYLEEQDARVQCGRDELLNAGINRLVRFAREQLPSGIANAAGLKIERTWVTAKLESTELLQALGYVYAKLYEAVRLLADHLERTIPSSIPRPSDMGPLREAARQVEFVKLKDMKTYRVNTKRIRAIPHTSLPDSIRESVIQLKAELGRPSNFLTTLEYYSRMAEATFRQWGNHIPMIFLLNTEWAPIDMIAPGVEDQADKYFFWRSLAERIALQNVHALVYTAEVWIRDLRGHPTAAISELPIIGEKLQLCGFDRERNTAVRSWEIIRQHGSKAMLGPRQDADEGNQRMFFLVPAMRSMGIEPRFIPKRDGPDG